MSFKEQQQALSDNIQEVILEYNKFVNLVAPKDYRTTGRHFCNLRDMKEQINNLTEASKKDREFYRNLRR